MIVTGLIAAIASLGASEPRQDDPRAERDAREFEAKHLRPIFDKCYEAGSDYYRNGWRSEALWCFDRATKILPEAGNLTRFVGLLRDFDNPIWKKKHWKSPRKGVDAEFKRRQEQYDAAYVAALLEVGTHQERRDDSASVERAATTFRTILKTIGGPYEVDAEGRIIVGKAGTLSLAASKRLLEHDLVLINGKRWLRDSMLRSLADTSAVFEARNDQVLVRTVTTLEEAQRLFALLEQAYPQYEKQLGERKTPRPLGLFVFADQASYQTWCKANGKQNYLLASGLANSAEGFAVTFAQASVDKTAVHEAAHLYHFDVFASPMPSWYAEGVACWFGHDHSMSISGGKLKTGIQPTKSVLAHLLKGGQLALPLADLLHSDAAVRIAANDGSATDYYLQSWALYCYFTTTTDTKLSGLFNEWESFTLGSRGGGETDAATLFDRVFQDAMPQLESGFTAWAADPG